MQGRFLATSIAAAITVGMAIAACTGPAATDVSRTPPDDLADTGLSATAIKAYKVAATPRKGTVASFIKDDGRKFAVTDFTADTGRKTKATMNDRSGKASQVDVLEGTATCKAVVGSGTAHEITFAERLAPLMSDMDNTCVVTDKTSGNTRTYQSDQEFQRFTVSDAGQQLTIITNPDGSYQVNGSAGATPADAAKLIVGTPLGKGTSVHSLAAIYGTVMQRRKNLQQTLIPSTGNPNPNGPADDPAELILAVIDALSK